MHEHDDNEFINSNSNLGKLIAHIKCIEKKPALDNTLSEILDEFLTKLKESETFLANGICQMNFSEAAFLLQSSALVYGKKVDILWETVNECQKRMVSLKFNNEAGQEELKKLEEQELKYRRRRRIIEQPNVRQDMNNFHIDWDHIDNYENVSCTRDDKIFSSWNGNVSNFDSSSISIDKETITENTRFEGDSIYSEDQEDEFIAHTSSLESVKGLDNIILNPCEKLRDFHLELITELYLLPKFLAQNKLTHEDLEKHNTEFEKFVNNYKDHFFNDFLKPELRQTPQKLRRMSMAPSPDGSIKFFQECKVKLLRLSNDDMNRLRFSSDEIEPNLSTLGVLEEIEKSSTPVIPSDEILNPSSNDEDDCNNNNVTLTQNENAEPSDTKTSKKERERRTIEENEDMSEIPLKRRKLSKTSLRKLATGITVDQKEFNAFFAANYMAEEDEGLVEDEQDDSIDSCEDFSQNDSTKSLLNSSMDSGYESHFHDETDDFLETTDKLSRRKNQEEPSTSQHDGKTCENVLEWKQHMNKKLKSISSSDFDIRCYNSKVIENLDAENGRQKNFSDFVRGKNSAEVARFFMSTLHLANSCNVEIHGVQNGKQSNDTLSVKLVNKEWHFDKIEDYIAPSEMNYEERMSESLRFNKRTLPGTSGYSQSKKRNRFQ